MAMIFNLFRKSAAPSPAEEGYRAIVAQSRQVKFYADWGVPDTVTGRFDMISLHLVLHLRRLRAEPAAKDYGQALVNVFFRDMDHSIRELGVTDLGVGPRIKKMGNVFYGLVGALGEAIDSGSVAAVEAVLVRNIYDGPDPGAAQLARYLLDEAGRLDSEPVAALTFAGAAA
jgi:cytochrome b pre-mRNA-processing protein 3